MRSRWSEMLADAEQNLRARNYEAARSTAIELTEQMTRHLGPGRKAEVALGRILLLRALAEHGLENRDDSLWYWSLAIAIDPELEKIDLRSFGDSGAYLMAHLPSGAWCEGEVLEGSDITPPKIRGKTPPEYPPGAMNFVVEGQLVVRVIIDEAGEVHHPQVREALPAPTLTLAALEAVRKWQFTPAQVDGEPIRTCYELTVNYDAWKL